SSPLRSPLIQVCPPQSAGSGALTAMVPPVEKVIVSAPLVLLAAMTASRSETLPSAPGKSLTVPVPQRPSSSNGGSAVSARVVTTMSLARVGEARPPRTRQQAVAKIAIKPRVTLFVCIMVLRLELVLKVGRSCHCEELEATKQSLFRQRLLRSARKDS